MINLGNERDYMTYKPNFFKLWYDCSW